jgi:hypothetical protein
MTIATDKTLIASFNLLSTMGLRMFVNLETPDRPPAPGLGSGKLDEMDQILSRSRTKITVAQPFHFNSFRYE